MVAPRIPALPCELRSPAAPLLPVAVAGLVEWLISRAHVCGPRYEPSEEQFRRQAEVTPQTCGGILEMPPRPGGPATRHPRNNSGSTFDLPTAASCLLSSFAASAGRRGPCGGRMNWSRLTERYVKIQGVRRNSRCLPASGTDTEKQRGQRRIDSSLICPCCSSVSVPLAGGRREFLVTP